MKLKKCYFNVFTFVSSRHSLSSGILLDQKKEMQPGKLVIYASLTVPPKRAVWTKCSGKFIFAVIQTSMKEKT